MSRDQAFERFHEVGQALAARIGTKTLTVEQVHVLLNTLAAFNGLARNLLANQETPRFVLQTAVGLSNEAATDILGTPADALDLLYTAANS